MPLATFYGGFMRKLFHIIFEFIFSANCPICKNLVSEHGQMCGECWSKFNWISDPKCHICGYPFPANIDLGPSPLCPVCAASKNELDWVRSACVYDDFSRDIILPFKYASRFQFKRIIARAMINCARELPTHPDIVMPIPLANKRLRKRGYNQAALLAVPIAKYLGVKVDYDSMYRIYREDMGNKTAKQREANIKGVFKMLNPNAVRGKTILLIDDVMTSGNTFKEMRRILKKNGAVAVYGISFCRTVREI